MKTVIGKNTLGGGKKIATSLNNYNRSTHDLSFVMRTTMAPGVLVPTMKLLLEPGDTFTIKARYHTLTHPTVGPLFGSFKQQNDYFFCPIRLYNAMLHNNTLNVGLDMSKIKLPKFKWMGTEWTAGDYIPGSNKTLYNLVHPSSLLAYLGYRSIVRSEDYTSGNPEWQCVPILAYYDIFKNYYANKQETKFYTIAASSSINSIKTINQEGYALLWFASDSDGAITNWSKGADNLTQEIRTAGPHFGIYTNLSSTESNPYIDITIELEDKAKKYELKGFIKDLIKNNKLTSIPKPTNANETVNNQGKGYYYSIINVNIDGRAKMVLNSISTKLTYASYDLELIDILREKILSAGRNQFYISDSNAPFIQYLVTNDSKGHPKTSSPMTGLCLKTYQSDINTNWVKTEWIDGDNGINEITAIDTSSGSFSIDQLNLAQKVYKMLNRIAVSDGSYNAWIQTIFTSGGLNHIETPIYIGGQSQEIEFQEVVSQSATDNEPLGSLAGRGVITQRKGEAIKFKADEPGYIMCITSLTPRVDYFQGNEWDLYLENLDQLHKPQLDGIGFQDRLYRNMNANVPSQERKKNIGKQPAWIEYMTNVNKTYGNFALIENEGWMCLNRIFGGVETYTTYIQPHMYNNIFAETEATAQNFWVQIAFDIKARRVMSAKQIPNL